MSMQAKVDCSAALGCAVLGRAGMCLLYFNINLVSSSSTATVTICTISTSARHHATISHHYRIRPMLARPNTQLHHSYTHSPRHLYLCLYSVFLCPSVSQYLPVADT